MKKITVMALMAVTTLALFAGCGKKEDEERTRRDKKNAPVEESVITEPSETEEPSTVDVTTVNPGDSEALYMDLVNNNQGSIKVADDNKSLPHGGTYNLDELLDAIAIDFDVFPTYHFEDKKYALIDCGLDGEPELAITCKIMNDSGADDYAEPTIIIKNIGGQLTFIDVEYTYYRFETEVNTAGYVCYAGSTGAGSYVIENKYIDGDGNVNFIYTMDGYMGLAKPVVYSYYLPEDIYEEVEWTDYENDYYECDAYSFEQFYWPVDNGYGDDYDEYVKEYSKTYFFAFSDANGNYVLPDDATCASYDQHDITYYDGNELQQILKEREEEFGLTDEIKNADYISWTDFN